MISTQQMMVQDNTPSHNSLTYAPKPRGIRRRYLRLIVFVLSLTIAIPIFWRFGLPHCRQVLYMRNQALCMSHQFPVMMLVYDDDPGNALELIKNANNYLTSKVLLQKEWYPQPPPSWKPPAGYFFKPFWRVRGFEVIGTAYLHRGGTRGGPERLIEVDVHCGEMGPGRRPISINAFSFKLADSKVGSKMSILGYPSGLVFLVPASRRLRVYGGQPDRNDPSHFTIPYRVDDEPGVIDGWVREPTKDRMKSVKLVIRNGPLILVALSHDSDNY